MGRSVSITTLARAGGGATLKPAPARASVDASGGRQTRHIRRRKVMALHRRALALGGVGAFAVAIMGHLSQAIAQPTEEAAVKAAVEAFRKAMLGNDRAQLDALTVAQLSYGHSSGKVQNKAEFIDGAVNSRWKSISVSDETTNIVGVNAISRFLFTGENESDGKVNAVKIGVLMVWLKQDGHWKLLARQAVKV
jgi:hypothetical protein